ncbi:hypothetical protein HPB49_008141 [Dermacentor silvarum]|uniref:Uncharacterized protein n=1 Tax=Dermacentor silvarum TaxID=543639 RepID=A0ACB8D481_DERSI|nr:hypothetical protein HPB49_008141 [Dermacentor silvarum]
MQRTDESAPHNSMGQTVHSKLSKPVEADGRANEFTSLPRNRSSEIDSAEIQTRLWKRCPGLVDSFWQRWRREYLLQLRPVHVTKPGRGRSISKGEIVLIGDNRASRQM